jgi:hypothetical protein
MGTLLLDLLTPRRMPTALRFNIALLTSCVVEVRRLRREFAPAVGAPPVLPKQGESQP